MRAYLDWGLQNPGVYRLMFEWGYLGDISEEAIFARRASWRRTRNVIERGIEEGALREGLDSATAADTIWVSAYSGPAKRYRPRPSCPPSAGSMGATSSGPRISAISRALRGA